MNPIYPVYVISKGRWESRLTVKALERMKVPYHVVIEPQEYDQYASVVDPAKIHTLPFSNLGLGSIPARNWVWDHSISIGAKRHWILDDNIDGFYRLNHNLKVPVATGTTFRVAEDFVDRYENVGISGFHYFMFASRKTKLPPYIRNTRVYSCIMIKNDLPYRWRGRYNEDTDLSLRALKDGWATVLFLAFLAFKSTTMTMKGGNTDELYVDDGRLKMAQSLQEQHPDVTKITRKWGRWQHHVDYSGFRKNKMILKPGVVIPKGIDNFGMVLHIDEKKETEAEKPAQAIFVSEGRRWPVTDRLDALPELGDAKRVVVDWETTDEPWIFDRRPTGLGFMVPGGGPRGYASFAHPGAGNFPEETVRRWARAELRGRELIVANAKHEADTFYRWGVDLETSGSTWNDVFHQASLLQEQRRKCNLELLGQEEFGRGKVETGGIPIHLLPVERAGIYNAGDLDLTWDLHQTYQPRIEEEDLGRVLKLENDLVWSTTEMERNGSYIDVELLAKWDAEMVAEHAARIVKIYEATGLRINPGASDDMEKLFRNRGAKSSFLTEHGAESFTEEALLEHTDDSVINLALEARQIISHRNKYTKKYLTSVRPDGRIFYSLHQLRGDKGGTITGRYSSSAMYDGPEGGINIQQVAKYAKMPDLLKRWPIRQAFVPPFGRSYLSGDASQIEYRIFAHYAELLGISSRVAEAYRSNPKTDFHGLAVTFTGLIREFAKNVNFCKLYGGRAKKIAYMCGVAESEGYRIEAKYDREFPEANRLLEAAEKQARRIGYVRTFLGRRRRYALNSAIERYYSAMNAVFQGGAADLMKLKLLRLYNERKRIGLTLRSSVHDEANGDVPNAEALVEVQKVFDEPELDLLVPIRWEVKTGANWHEAH